MDEIKVWYDLKREEKCLVCVKKQTLLKKSLSKNHSPIIIYVSYLSGFLDYEFYYK